MSKRKTRAATKAAVEAIKDSATATRELTLKQEAFFHAYIETKNASEAYRRAYDVENMSAPAIQVEASRLLNHPIISLLVENWRKSAAADSLLTLEQHMEELQTLREMAKSNAQLSAAITAEVKRGELRKFYVKQIETGDAGDFKQLSDEDLRAEAEMAAVKLNIKPSRVNGSGTQH